MAKPHLILIHGMGEHEKDEFLKSFFEPLDAATKHFNSMKELSKSVIPYYIDYNDLIKDVRNVMKKATIDDLHARFPGAPSFIAKINELNRKFAEDDSFWFTHVLDVAIYRSIYADAIQARVGKQLIEAMQAATDAKEDIHIVCHSLGTAVMHDTLHKLYTNGLNDQHGKLLLSAGLNKIRSITMVANVCTLPITEATPYTSVVKPGPDGICDHFMTCRHVLDPFASIVKFDQGAHWPNVHGSIFRNTVIKRVERANVHDLDHYLADPSVYLPLFMNLFPVTFKTTAAELKAAKDAHDKTTLQGKFEKLKTHMEDAEITLYWNAEAGEFVFSDNVQAMYENLSSFVDHLKAIEVQIKNLTGSDDNE